MPQQARHQEAHWTGVSARSGRTCRCPGLAAGGARSTQGSWRPGEGPEANCPAATAYLGQGLGTVISEGSSRWPASPRVPHVHTLSYTARLGAEPVGCGGIKDFRFAKTLWTASCAWHRANTCCLLPAVAAAVPGLSGGPERYPHGALCPGVQLPEVASQGDGVRVYGAPCSADARSLCPTGMDTPRGAVLVSVTGVAHGRCSAPLTGDIGENAWDSENS